MRPRRLVYLGAGTSIHLRRWLAAFAERGDEVHLVTMHPSDAELHPAVTEHRLPWAAPWGYRLNRRALRRLLDHLAPDLVHAHYATGYAWLARAVAHRPWLLSVWGSDVFDFPRTSPWHRRLVVRNLLAADALASTSAVMARQTRALVGGRRAVAVTPFGVDVERFAPVESMPSERPVVGTVKTLAAKYAIDVLLTAVARLPQTVQVVLAGDGPQRAELESLAEELGIAHRVRWLGQIAHREVPDVLGGMDVYVAVSRLDSESFGVAVVEAQACGLPVVVSDAGGLPEVVRDGETGIVVPREDVEATAEAIAGLLDDPERARAMGRAGRRHVCATYTWPHCIERMDAWYRAVLAARG